MEELDRMFDEFGIEVLKEEKVEEPEVEQKKQEVQKQIEQLEIQVNEILQEETIDEAKEVFMIFGEKGHGKTVQALSFPGEIAAFSFDGKTMRIKVKYFNNDKRLHVYDVNKLLDFSTPDRIKQSAAKAYYSIVKTLEALNGKMDYIVFDGTEILQLICEWTVRYEQNIDTFAGMEYDKWKDRRAKIKHLHNLALRVAKKGVIYTAYPQKDEIIVEGEFIAKRDVPRWIDAIVTETDYVLQVFKDSRDGRHKVKVVSSKDKNFLPEKTFDVEGRSLWEVKK